MKPRNNILTGLGYAALICGVFLLAYGRGTHHVAPMIGSGIFVIGGLIALLCAEE